MRKKPPTWKDVVDLFVACSDEEQETARGWFYTHLKNRILTAEGLALLYCQLPNEERARFCQWLDPTLQAQYEAGDRFLAESVPKQFQDLMRKRSRKPDTELVRRDKRASALKDEGKTWAQVVRILFKENPAWFPDYDQDKELSSKDIKELSDRIRVSVSSRYPPPP